MNIYNIVPYIRYSVYRKCHKGWQIPMRTIPDHEFVLVECGKGIVTIEGKKYPASAGNLFYFHPGLANSMQTDDNDLLRFLAVHFSFTCFEYNNSKWSINHYSESCLPVSVFMKLKYYHLSLNTMKKLDEYWNKKQPGYELICRGLFQKLLYEIVEDGRIKQVNYSANLRIENIIEYIRDNIGRKLTIKELSDKSGLSGNYLSKLFKKYTGYSLVEYKNRLKIDFAKELIVGKQWRIKEVASKAGFSDEFYFSRLFKKLEGISPLDFQNRIRN